MKVAYYDRDQKPISEKRWRELQQDEGYSVLKRFRDDRVHIEARWIGELKNPASYFPYLRPVFAILVFNRDSEGEWRQDPAHGSTFHNEKKLLEFFDNYLLSWTKSTLTEEGELEMVGNELAEVPESSNAPGAPKITSASNLVGVDSEVAAVGAW